MEIKVWRFLHPLLCIYSKLSIVTEIHEEMAVLPKIHRETSLLPEILSEMHKDIREMKGLIRNPLPQPLKAHLDSIPSPPTEMFAGREEYLQEMKHYFISSRTTMESRTQRRFVLFGIGGMGKTQIVLKFMQLYYTRCVI